MSRIKYILTVLLFSTSVMASESWESQVVTRSAQLFQMRDDELRSVDQGQHLRDLVRFAQQVGESSAGQLSLEWVQQFCSFIRKQTTPNTTRWVREEWLGMLRVLSPEASNHLFDTMLDMVIGDAFFYAKDETQRRQLLRSIFNSSSPYLKAKDLNFFKELYAKLKAVKSIDNVPKVLLWLCMHQLGWGDELRAQMMEHLGLKTAPELPEEINFPLQYYLGAAAEAKSMPSSYLLFSVYQAARQCCALWASDAVLELLLTYFFCAEDTDFTVQKSVSDPLFDMEWQPGNRLRIEQAIDRMEYVDEKQYFTHLKDFRNHKGASTFVLYGILREINKISSRWGISKLPQFLPELYTSLSSPIDPMHASKILIDRVLDGESAVYDVRRAEKGYCVYKCNARTGEAIWSYEVKWSGHFQTPPLPKNPVAVGRSHVYLLTCGGSLLALEKLTGKPSHAVRPTSYMKGIVATKDDVLVGVADKDFLCLRLESLECLPALPSSYLNLQLEADVPYYQNADWSSAYGHLMPLPEGRLQSAGNYLVYTDDRTIYTYNHNQKSSTVVCTSPDSAIGWKSKWSIFGDDLIYSYRKDDLVERLGCMDLLSGRINWQWGYCPDHHFIQAPVLSEDGQRVYMLCQTSRWEFFLHMRGKPQDPLLGIAQIELTKFYKESSNPPILLAGSHDRFVYVYCALRGLLLEIEVVSKNIRCLEVSRKDLSSVMTYSNKRGWVVNRQPLILG